MFITCVQSDDSLDAPAAGPGGVYVRRGVTKTQYDAFAHSLFDLGDVGTVKSAVHSTFTAWIANWITRVELCKFIAEPADARKHIRARAFVDQRERSRAGVGRYD